MSSEDIYKVMALINKRPGSEKYVDSLYKLLKSEDRFFSQEEVKQFLVLPFETYMMLKNYSFEYIDRVYGSPIYNFRINASNREFSQLIFCTKKFFLDLSSEILVETFNNLKSKSLTVKELEKQLRKNLEVYLGLGDREFKQFPPEIITTIVDSFPEKFVLQSKSVIDDKWNIKVSMEVNELAYLNPLLFLNKLITLSRKNSTENTKALLLKLNLSTEDFGMTKPYSYQSIEKIADNFPETLKFTDTHISILPLNDRINNSLNNKSKIDNFPLNEAKLSGLLIFSYVGDAFPLVEAVSYVSLRSYVNFVIVSDLKMVYNKIFSDTRYELTRILTVLLGRTDISEWAKENLAVSFLIEDYEYLKLNFDSLMQEYSPVFNLEKNPGNLFRGIIEEKIREYENEQRTKN